MTPHILHTALKQRPLTPQSKFTLVAFAVALILFGAWQLYARGAVQQSVTLSRPSLESGLVGHWTMDGKNVDLSQGNAEIRDSSGQGNHGDWLNHASTTVAGAVGQGVETDGVDDTVKIPSSSNYNVTSSGFSAFVWFKKDDICNSPGASNNEVLLSRFGVSDTNTTWWLGCVRYDATSGTPNGLVLWAYPGSGNISLTSTSAVNDGTWHHGGWVYDGSAVRLYLDGKEVDSFATSTLSISSSNPLCIGAYNASCGDYEFGGDLDDVRVYNRALTANEVNKLYRLGGTSKINKTLTTRPPLESGLVGHWTMDGKDVDLSQGNAEIRDSSGQGNHGDWLNHASTTAPGRVGQGVEFDGVDDVVNISDPGANSVLDLPGDFTISAWVFPKSLPSSGVGGNPRIVQKGVSVVSEDAAGAYVLMVLTSGGLPYVARFDVSIGGGVYVATGTSAFAAGEWRHVAVARKGTALYLYVDGVLEKTETISSGNIDQHNEVLKIGESNNSDGAWSGMLDDIRIYNRALTANEVGKLYRLGATSKINQTLTTRPSLERGLIGYWTMDGKNVDLSQGNAEIRDSSGQGNHGDWLNHASTTAPGRVGQGVEFDGVDDVVNFGSASAYDNMGPYSACAWVYPRTGGENGLGFILTKDSKNTILYDGTGTVLARPYLQINYSTTNLTASPAGGVMPLKTWTHVCLTWDGSTTAANAKFYINGTYVSNASASDGAGTRSDDSAGNLLIGESVGGSRAFDGVIDDVRLYNRVLSAGEVEAIYRGGR